METSEEQRAPSSDEPKREKEEEEEEERKNFAPEKCQPSSPPPPPIPTTSSHIIANENDSEYQYRVYKICDNGNWISTNGVSLQRILTEAKAQNYETILVPIETIREEDEQDPLDLTLSSARDSTSGNSSSNLDSSGCANVNVSVSHSFDDAYVPKKRGRKRKYVYNDTVPEMAMNLSSCSDQKSNVCDKQTEVLIAAKSLFSKRTRTLYHWIHPEMSKAQIKADVNAAWEMLPEEQREFYVSQVLGKFGFPQCSLMVNPQLRKVPNEELVQMPSAVSDSYHHHPVQHHHRYHQQLQQQQQHHRRLLNELSNETNGAAAVSELELVNWHLMSNRPNRRRKRFGRISASAAVFGDEGAATINANREPTATASVPAPLETIDQSAAASSAAATTYAPNFGFAWTDEPNLEDDFKDDPELSRELQQFRWTLHLSNELN